MQPALPRELAVLVNSLPAVPTAVEPVHTAFLSAASLEQELHPLAMEALAGNAPHASPTTPSFWSASDGELESTLAWPMIFFM